MVMCILHRLSSGLLSSVPCTQNRSLLCLSSPDVSDSFGLITVSWTPAVNVLSVARQEESEGLSGSGHFSHWTQLMKALGPHDAEILSYKEPLVGIDLGYSPYAVSNHRKSTGEMRIHNIHSRS